MARSYLAVYDSLASHGAAASAASKNPVSQR
jgi:hypothetical protein